MSELESIARALVAEGKGILAADESDGTIKKRFDSIGVESTEDNRRAYRELLFTTEGAEEYISGVILFDETIRQTRSDGTPFPKLLESKGVIPGIKVDKGAKPLALRRGRDGHRGPRRAARAARGVPRARRAVRQVARDVLDRRRQAERVLRLDERPRARALRGAVPGGGHRADRRAGGAAWTARTRSSRARRRPAACSRPSTPSCTTSASTTRGTLLKPNMVLSGYDASRARRRRRGRGGDARVLLQARAGGGARDRLPLRRPDRRGRDGAPERDERARPAPVAALVLVRPRAAGAGAQGVGAASRRTSRPAQRAYYHRAKMNGAARTGHVRARDGTRDRPGVRTPCLLRPCQGSDPRHGRKGHLSAGGPRTSRRRRCSEPPSVPRGRTCRRDGG